MMWAQLFLKQTCMSDTQCPECGGMMDEDNGVMRCEDCGYVAPSYGDGAEESGADDMG